jgi:hypothetical protein
MEHRFMRTLIGALALTLGAMAGASAGELLPSSSHSVDLGSLKGVAYYTVETSGEYKVVVTVAQNESVSPVRFVALLRPDQKVALSVPGTVGSRDATMEIARQGDAVVVSTAHLATP